MREKIRIFGLFLVLSGCLIPSEKTSTSAPDIGGGAVRFSVPVPPGYDWEVTQSWGEHCETCNNRYDDWDFCDSSHTLSCCEYAWDFNLPGSQDLGKPALAAGDGTVRDMGDSNSWGTYVVLDHGSGICTRYAHLVQGSTEHLEEGQAVCQGLHLGGIGDSGLAEGVHLHFQFEDCNTQESVEMSFSDGNGIPVCTYGDDVYDSHGNYDFLHLVNQVRLSCFGVTENPPDTEAELPRGGWLGSNCGTLPGCPLGPNCDRRYGHEFNDQYSYSSEIAAAAKYLWSECAIDGEPDGRLDPFDNITRAEALKIPLYLFGLMEECGEAEPFADVDQDDWFFSVVACAVQQRILNNAVAYFNPNRDATFGEAAKFLVESALTNNIVGLQNPWDGHFPNIDNSHWAYQYVETLYEYGGIGDELLLRSAESSLSRGEYMIMAASMSPCFCGNVICTDGCGCEQRVYGCTDPNDTSIGIGGNEGEDDEDDGSDEDDGEGDDDEDDEDGSGGDEDDRGGDEASVPDLGIDCHIEEENCRCEEENTILYIKCSLRNDGEETVRVNNLVMELRDCAGCVVTDPDLRSGVGTQNVAPGESRDLTGHFEITCEDEPSTGELELTFDLVTRNGGETETYRNILEDTMSVGSGVFESCGSEEGSGTDADPDSDSVSEWCYPAGVYTLFMYSRGGSMEILASGETPYVSAEFTDGMAIYVDFECADFPAAALIRGGPEGVHAWAEGFLENFAVWFTYEGELCIDPPIPTYITTHSFSSFQEDVDILIRIPPE